jgi:hypothetical protein
MNSQTVSHDQEILLSVAQTKDFLVLPDDDEKVPHKIIDPGAEEEEKEVHHDSLIES